MNEMDTMVWKKLSWNNVINERNDNVLRVERSWCPLIMSYVVNQTEQYFLTIYKQTMEKNSYNYSPQHWKIKQEKNCN